MRQSSRRFALRALSGSLLAFSLAFSPAWAGGNEALMREWMAKKRQVREEVFESLQKQGVLPRDGSVEFTAVVKPDPDFPDKTKIYIESISVLPAQNAKPGLTGGAAPAGGLTAAGGAPSGPARIEGKDAAQALEQAFKPIPIPGASIPLSLDIPVGASVSDKLTVANGRLSAEDLAPPNPTFPAVEPLAAPAPVPASGEEKSWWGKFLDYFKF